MSDETHGALEHAEGEPQHDSIPHVVIAAWRGTERAHRRALGIAALILVATLAFNLLDFLEERTAETLLDLIGQTLIVLGFLVMSVATTLHQATQSLGACSLFRPRLELGMETRRLHSMLGAFPVLLLIAASLLSAGTATFVSAPEFSPGRLPMAVVGVGMIVWCVALVRRTAGFLYEEARSMTEAAARAEGAATEAQLAALQAQTNPHFLFNALNTVASLVRTGAPGAEPTVENLAHVLRRTLDRSRKIMTTVEDEVDYVRAYLSIEEERYGERLRVEWAVDSETLPLQIPTMALQPLVENSLRHGIGNRLEGGVLRISAWLEEGELVLEVWDDGPGFGARHQEGNGLTNLRERLETIYGAGARLVIDRDEPGATVRVEILVGESGAVGEPSASETSEDRRSEEPVRREPVTTVE